jgi:hypothetical protein
MQDVLPNNFPATYFLHYQVFKHCHLAIQKPQLALPPRISNPLKCAKLVRHIAEQFFSSVHLWFPIISRNKFYGSLLHLSLLQEADLALLVLSMQILGSRQYDNAQSHEPIYVAIKHLFVELEQAGVLNITVLQALLLTTIYELGKGIYPAAYLTIGNCARYAVALGLDREIFNWDHHASEWVVMEEKHRVWWAIVILDRYVVAHFPVLAEASKSNESKQDT